jgi:hypothetical protein
MTDTTVGIETHIPPTEPIQVEDSSDEITYSWKLTGLKRRDSTDLNNIVIQTYWEKTGTDKFGNTGMFVGATPLPLSSVNPDNFVSYDDLTEEMILDWIIPLTNNAHVDELIQKQINEKINPIIEVRGSEFPWIPKEEVVAEPVGVATTSTDDSVGISTDS